MPRKAGSAKTGGRKAGTPNRATLQLHNELKRNGVDVVAELSKTLGELSTDRRASILLELVSYLYPKRKAVEDDTYVEEKPQEITITFVSAD